MYCENGQALSIYEDFCEGGHACPIGTDSYFALTSNCSKISNHFCPIYHLTSKICLDKVDVNITNYCKYGRNDEEPWICPKANKGLSFVQCYDL